ACRSSWPPGCRGREPWATQRGRGTGSRSVDCCRRGHGRASPGGDNGSTRRTGRPQRPRAEARRTMTNEHSPRTAVGMIQTARGPVQSERLGVTSTHEHVLVDLSPLQKPPVEASRRARFYAPVTIELLGSINYGGQTNLDNSRLLDIDTAIAETTI